MVDNFVWFDFLGFVWLLRTMLQYSKALFANAFSAV